MDRWFVACSFFCWYNAFMTKELEKIKKIAVPILKKSGIKRSAIFGSYARSEQNKKSDIDFLIKFESRKRASLFTVVDLKNKLEDALHKGVDLVDFDSVHPLLKKYIAKDQIKIL